MSGIGPVERHEGFFIDDKGVHLGADPPFSNRLYAFARAHDAEDAALRAALRQAGEALRRYVLDDGSTPEMPHPSDCRHCQTVAALAAIEELTA